MAKKEKLTREQSPPKDYAPAGVREQVRQTTTQAWGEPTSLIYFGKVQLSYSVPGRRNDGTVKGENQVGYVLKVVFSLLWLLSVLLIRLPLLILEEYFQLGIFHGGTTVPRFGAKISVKGPAQSIGLPLFDAARTAKRGLWLVSSHSHLALVQAQGKNPPCTLWEATGSWRPHFKFKEGELRAELTWPDGSSFTFMLGSKEWEYFKRFRGHQ